MIAALFKFFITENKLSSHTTVVKWMQKQLFRSFVFKLKKNNKPKCNHHLFKFLSQAFRAMNNISVYHLHVM